MTVVGQRLHIRLFLEGVEVPVIAAMVQSQPNAPAVASIQIPPSDFALDLRPRTLVHLFFYDMYRGAPVQDRIAGAGITIRNEVDPDVQSVLDASAAETTSEQAEADLENENYKLLFGGEVLGLAFTKTPYSRNIVLQCADWSSYWDIAFQYQNGGNLFGPGLRAAFTGASTTLFNSFLDGSGDVVARLFSTPPRSYPTLRGTLLGGIVHLLEAIGGIYFGPRGIRGTNDFFSFAEMRLHLTQMVGANPYSERDERRLLSANGFGSIFSKALGNLGKQVSVRAVINALQKYIFHETVPITSPKYIPALFDPLQPNVQTTTIRAERSLQPLTSAAGILKRRVADLSERLGQSTTAQTAVQQSGRDLQRVMRRLARDADLADRRARALLSATSGGQARYVDSTATARAKSLFATVGGTFNTAYAILEQSNNGATPFVFPLASSREGLRMAALFSQISTLLDEFLNLQLQKRIPRQSRSQPYPPARLLTQIYRPDVWMVAPPRCNVIFPEGYSQLQYSRDFSQEPSRLLLRTHSAFFGSDMLFDGFYFAPSRLTSTRSGGRQFRGRASLNPPEAADSPMGMVRHLMDHELYTGIIPVFERMSDLNLHALRGGTVEIDGVRVQYAQLAANHIFFQRRFQSRQLAVQGKFNPYLALGFPALVVDRYLSAHMLGDPHQRQGSAAATAELLRDGEGEGVPEDPEERERIRAANDARVTQARSALIENRPLTHYLGTPQMISHTLSAHDATGNTSVQMGYARTTNERTEFLGDNLNAAPTARRTRNVRISTEIAAFDPPQIGDRGIRGGRIVEVTDVTDRYQRRAPTRTTDRTVTGQTQYTGGPRLPLFVPGRDYNGRRRRTTSVLVGVTQPAASYGPEVVGLVGTTGSVQTGTGESAVLVTFRGFRITEEIGAYERELATLPPEDYTFPPWYGEHYRSQNIGGLYSYFFGTGAITDPTSVVTPGAAPRDGVPATASPDAAQIDTVAGVDSPVSPSTDFVGQPGVSEPSIPGGGTIGPPGEPAETTLGAIESRASIEFSVDELVRIYSRVKNLHLDTDQFIRSYTWRPVASMVDMFGTSNLEIDDRGAVLRGVEGFHSRAFGDYDDLRTLVAPGDDGQPPTILGLQVYDQGDADNPEAQPSGDAAVASRLDSRKEKRLQVLKFLHDLVYSRGVG